MQPLAFPQGVYTHIYFAFGSINPDTFEVIPGSSGDEQLYVQLQALQTRDSGQARWLSIGGWDFTDSGEPTATTFSDLAAADITYQNVFFASLTLFMATWGFTGVDIDWEYPAADDRNGRAEDYGNYPVFLANLKSALDEYKFGLSITLPTSYWYLQHFDLAAIEPSVDWFNYMSYDLHGTWDIGDQWTGAFLDAHTNLTEIKEDLDLLWRNNITAAKVNLGLAFYGRSFTLASSSCSQPGCSYLSAGDAGECSSTAGILLNSEIGQIISENSLTPILYSDAAVKSVSWNEDQWVSFDDQDTWKIKADFAKSQCVGGVFVWSVDYDDYNHTYSNGLAAALGNPINVDTSSGLSITLADTATGSQETQDQYCRFINCGETCPNGFTTIVRDDDKGQIVLDSTECLSPSDVQTLCCPTSTEVPRCQWRGFHNSGHCNGGCNSGEAELGTINAGCSSGYQSACCAITASTTPWANCQWTSGCESDNTCPSGYSNYVAGSRNGWGGLSACNEGENYNYCCAGSVPDPFTNCDWHGGVAPQPPNSRLCSDACPSGSIRIAEEQVLLMWGYNQQPRNTDSDCVWGHEALCCSGPSASSVSPRGPDPSTPQTQDGQEFEALLQKFFAAPTCPSGWDDQYSSSFSLSARDLDKRLTSDQSDTLTLLLPILSALVTSQYPREDLCDIWDYELNSNGYGSSGANCSTLN
jgi:chitinase